MEFITSLSQQFEESQIPLSQNVNKAEDAYSALLHEEYDIKSEFEEDIFNWPNLDSESDKNTSGITTPKKGKVVANEFVTPQSIKDALNLPKDEIKTERVTPKKHKKKRNRLNSTSSSVSSDFGAKQPKIEDYFGKSPMYESFPHEKRQSEGILSDEYSGSLVSNTKKNNDNSHSKIVSPSKKKLKEKPSDEDAVLHVLNSHIDARKLSDIENSHTTKKKRKKDKSLLNDNFSEQNEVSEANVQIDNTMYDLQSSLSTKKKSKKRRTEESVPTSETLSDEGSPVLYTKKKKKSKEKPQNILCEKSTNKKNSDLSPEKIISVEHSENDKPQKLKKKKVKLDIYTESEVSQNSENEMSFCETKTSPEPKKKKKKKDKEAKSTDNSLENELKIKDSSLTHNSSGTESLPNTHKKRKSTKQSEPSKFLNMEKFFVSKNNEQPENSLSDKSMPNEQLKTKKKEKKKNNEYPTNSCQPAAGCSHDKYEFSDSDNSKYTERKKKKKHKKDKTERVKLLKEENKFDETALSTDYSFGEMSDSSIDEKSKIKFDQKRNLSPVACSSKDSPKNRNKVSENKREDTSNFDISKKNVFAVDAKYETAVLEDTILELRYEDDLKSEDISNLKVMIPWNVPPSHEIETRISAQPSDQQKRKLKELGIEIKMGVFSQKEDAQLKKNWSIFVKLHDVPDDPAPFLRFTNSNKKRTLPLEERLNFAKFLAHGLENRLLYSVYNRFKRVFMERTIGRFSAQEDSIICKFMKHGNTSTPFSDLAKLLKREKWSVVKRWQQLKEEAVGGPKKVIWKRQTIEEFMKNFVEVTNIDDVKELKHREITETEWSKMERMMGIPKRKLKVGWKLIIYPRLFVKYRLYCGDVKKKLVKFLIKRGETDWRTVRWNEIAQYFDGFTGAVLCRIMKNDVRSKVPSNIQGNLKECLQYLHKIIKSGKYYQGRRLRRLKVLDNRE